MDSDCIILYATDAGYGASNDKSLMLWNEFHEKLKVDPVYTEFYYDILDENGELKRTKGAYTIRDGGFNTHVTTIATIHSPTAFKSQWTQRIESCRKDVERCFGHLKKRFQILRLSSNVFDFSQIKQAWRRCCVLHNILMRRRLKEDFSDRQARVQSGSFEDQDAAVIQAWHARDMEDAAFYAERLRARGDDVSGDHVAFPEDDAAMARRLQRARLVQRVSVGLNATSVAELQAYSDKQKDLITHYNALVAHRGVEHLAPERQRVMRSDDGAIFILKGSRCMIQVTRL